MATRKRKPKRAPIDAAKEAAQIATQVRALLKKASAPDPAAEPGLRRRVWKLLWDDERSERGAAPFLPAKVDLKVRPQSDRIVLFLGAGASVPHGYPATDQLLPSIWRALASPGRAWADWAGFRRWETRRGKRHAVPIARNASDLRRILTSILPGLAERDGDFAGASIIDVISMIEYCLIERHSPIEPPSLESRKQGVPGPGGYKLGVPVEDPSSELVRARHLVSMAINGVLQGKEARVMRESLAGWMVRRALRWRGRRVTLVSTNYDMLVESAIYDHLAALPRARRRTVYDAVDFGFTWRDPQGELRGRLPKAPLGILKLHGSLNWLRCEICGHVTINPTKRIASLDAWQVQNTYNSCECGGLLKSLLVTPSIVRDVRDPTLLSVWNAAIEDLRRADEWIFIGYSLPSEDVAIRSLLLRAFNTRQKRARLRVRVVSFENEAPPPPPVPKDAFRMFFPRQHFEDAFYEARGIQSFVSALGRQPALKRRRRRRRWERERRGRE